MKISVLTVSYNSAATIRQTLDSFCMQDWPHREMIVIDGASCDGTSDIGRSYAGETITLVSEPDRGMDGALNKALALYRGDAFGVLNSDDRYHDEGVLTSVAMALRDADAVQGHLDFVDGAQVRRRWRAEPRPASGFRSGWMPAHPTFYVRRHVADAVGRFDLTYAVASDYDWMLRAVDRCGFSIATLDRVMVDMALGGRSTRGLGAYVGHNLEARQRWLGAGLVDFALFAKPGRKLRQFVAPRSGRQGMHVA